MPAAFSAATIVALGKFDPDLFRLESLVKAGVISAAESERSRVKALLPGHIAHFALPWGELQVLDDRLHTTATEAPFVRVADLVRQSMNMLGDRCSLRAFGINFEAHFDVGSIAARDLLAIRVAPPDAWGEWGRGIRASMESTRMDVHGGMAVLTMRERFRIGEICGWYDVTLKSSERIPNNTGVQFLTNHHHEFSPDARSADTPDIRVDDIKQTAALLEALAAVFDESIGKGERIFAEVLA